jgi:hypothetical protein
VRLQLDVLWNMYGVPFFVTLITRKVTSSDSDFSLQTIPGEATHESGSSARPACRVLHGMQAGLWMSAHWSGSMNFVISQDEDYHILTTELIAVRFQSRVVEF